MWTTQATATCKATPEAVWTLWNTENWTKWDRAVEWVRLDGPFQAGTRGEMKPKGGPKTKFTVLRVDPHHGFTDRSHLPFTHLDFEHDVERVGHGMVKITHTVTFSGPLAFLFSRVIGKSIKEGLPDAVKTLAQLAEHDMGKW
jgi:hypothetical protein